MPQEIPKDSSTRAQDTLPFPVEARDRSFAVHGTELKNADMQAMNVREGRKYVDDREAHPRVVEVPQRTVTGAGERYRPGAENYEANTRRAFQPSADEIRDAVHDHLWEFGAADMSRISISVKDGEVTLSGTVNSREEKQRLEGLVKAVSGVARCHNRLQIEEDAVYRQDTIPENQ